MLCLAQLRDQDRHSPTFLETAMKTFLVTAALGIGFLLSAGAYAQAPAGATAQCKDGSYFSGTTHKGACRGHQGVKEWLNTPAASAAPAAAAADDAIATTTKKSKKAAAAAAAPAAPAVPAAPAATAAPAAASTAAAATPAIAAKPMPPKHMAPTPASQIAQKPGGGPGMVWVNSSSKVYHCQGDVWYGKTKEGSYMSEAAATTAGNHGAHGKECGK
jgi:hypothetical protein